MPSWPRRCFSFGKRPASRPVRKWTTDGGTQADATSMANRWSQLVAQRAYGVKQWVADSLAGSEYDTDAVQARIQELVRQSNVNNVSNDNTRRVIFLFDLSLFVDAPRIPWTNSAYLGRVWQLDQLPGHEGNEIRAQTAHPTHLDAGHFCMCAAPSSVDATMVRRD
mmetsp:Transcript_28636/g.78665  ORF Transcript_28636/g.78665 Transcript_28636/m.78665 type:complete len:166 (+) Transcript_28636:280-777(+)